MIFYLFKYYLESKLYLLMPEKWVKNRQLTRTRNMFEWTKENSKFYRNLYSEAGVLDLKIDSWEDVNKIPIVNKDMILANEIESNLTCLKSKNLVVSNTSGSTGKPMDIYLTKREHFTSYVRTFLALKGYNPFRVFVLIGLYQHKEKIEKQSFLYFLQKYFLLFRRERYSVSTPFNEILKKLNGRRIDTLSSTPSCLKILVDELKNSRKTLSVKYVIISGETLFDDLRADIKTFLQAKIINVYGCTEHLSMAWTLPDKKSFTYASNSVLIEYINPIEINGELYGELVITNFVNKTMPFVRYNIRDHVKIINSNKNMGEVSGRIEDIVEIDNGRRLDRLQVCDLYRSINECHQYKLLQKKDKCIYFQAVCKSDIDRQLLDQKIRDIWRAEFGDYPFEVEFLNELPLNPKSGKFKRMDVEI